MLYLLNTPILTTYGHYRFEGPFTLAAARQMLTEGFVSAIGHAGAAELLSQALEQTVELNRIAIAMQPGDRALVLRVTQRLPEGVVLSTDEMQALPWEIGLLTRIG